MSESKSKKKKTVTASTKSVPRGKRKTVNYNDIKKKDSSLSRNYELPSEQIAKIRAEAKAAGTTENPLGNRNGAYWGSVQSLIDLGIDKFHRITDIRDKMQEIMSCIEKTKKDAGKTVKTNAWDDFYNKKPRDASKPKDGVGRIKQNFSVLQRLPKFGGNEKNPYGLKLAQFGMTIDIEYKDEHGVQVPYFKLNTSWDDDPDGTNVQPLKPSRRKKKVPAKKIKKISTEDADKSLEGSESSETPSGAIAVSDEVAAVLDSCIECGAAECDCGKIPDAMSDDSEWEIA